MPSDAVRWCPHCRRLTQSAVTAPPVYDARWSEDPADDAPRLARFKRYCDQCQQIWDSVEAPAEAWAELLQLQAKLEDSRRQLAMLRLLLARDRRDLESETRQTIPLRRAA